MMQNAFAFHFDRHHCQHCLSGCKQHQQPALEALLRPVTSSLAASLQLTGSDEQPVKHIST